MKTIIVADNEPVTRMDLAEMLEGLGYQVVGEAADGFDAVEKCRHLHPDIAILDVKMPVFDGLTAAKTILEEKLAGCVVFLIPFDDREIIEKAKQTGATGYLLKPIRQKMLAPTLEAAYTQCQKTHESHKTIREMPNTAIRLDKKLWDRIAQSVNMIIGHDVLVTDINGIVICGSDPSRIGTLHGASKEVIRSGMQVYHDATAAAGIAGTKSGTTLPLIVNKQVIGTMGITGIPKEISQYVTLIQRFTQLFMDFYSKQHSSLHIDYKKRTLLHDICKKIPENMLENVRISAESLGFDFDVPRMALLIKGKPQKKNQDDAAYLQTALLPEVLRAFGSSQDFVCAPNESEAAVVVLAVLSQEEDAALRIRQKAQELLDGLSDVSSALQIGIGSPVCSIGQICCSYDDAGLAIRVLGIRGMQQGFLMAADIGLEKLALNMNSAVCEQVGAEQLCKMMNSKDASLVKQTILYWCQSRFNFSKTAEMMHIHKSTLVYRFRKLDEDLGINLYDFDKTISLYLILLRQELEADLLQ